MENEKAVRKYVIDSRMSGMFHPTRENIMKLFYEAQHSRETTINKINNYLDHLNGEQGEVDDSIIVKMQFTLMNCCFYFCEFLVENKIDSEVVYNTSDFFVNRIAKVRNEADYIRVFTSIADAFFELLSGKREIRYSRNIEKAISLINQQLYSPLRVNEIADELGLTPQYLTTAFKSETGKTIYRYINDKKLMEAKEMLKYTDDQVTIIASTLGFNSSAHFSAFFRKETGVTPTQYRLQSD